MPTLWSLLGNPPKNFLGANLFSRDRKWPVVVDAEQFIYLPKLNKTYPRYEYLNSALTDKDEARIQAYHRTYLGFSQEGLLTKAIVSDGNDVTK